MNCHQCSSSCHSPQKKGLFFPFFSTKNRKSQEENLAEIALVGMPNVGKSVLFNLLTGIYVTVSNYPGTTVEVSRGKSPIFEPPILVVDTPGLYSLLPITEEERVARDLLMIESVRLVIHVVDAKNLGRMLTLTLQLIEAGLPVLLAINMIDEAERLHLQIDEARLEKKLGIPVVKISAAKSWGLEQLKERIATYVN